MGKMSIPIRVTIVLLIATAAFATIVVAAEDSSRLWPLVACATALPVIAAVNAGRKGARIGGREGRA